MQKIGYIRVFADGERKRFEFREATFTRTINSRGDRIRSKMLQFPVDYEEITSNAQIMKEQSSLIIVREPFLLDDELRERCMRWCEWANQAEPWEYCPFHRKPEDV